MFIGKVICIALKILVLRGKMQLKIKEPIFGQFICGNCGKNVKCLIINIISLFLLTQIYNRIATLPQPLPHFSSRCHKLPHNCHKNTPS